MLKDKFKISLRENGEHSLKKSLESFSQYDKTKDQMLLKDTIMFLHHGIELLIKEMLVRHSPYLIFEELKDLPKKQKEATEKGVGIFDLGRPPKSVSYEVAINRVDAFLSCPELDNNLKENLERLNNLRNQLEHYAIEADREEIVKLLEAIHRPILQLFGNHIGPMPQLQTSQIKRIWNTISNAAQEAQQINHEIYKLMQNFDNQKVPGNLLGVDGEVTLPKFAYIFEEHPVKLEDFEGKEERIIFDIFAETANYSIDGKDARWVVETKLHTPQPMTIFKLKALEQLAKARSWLVVFDTLSPEIRQRAGKQQLMITGRNELYELEKILHI